MRALFDLLSQALVGLLVCSGLALGMSYVGSQSAVGQSLYDGTNPGSGEDLLVVGQCRQCANPIRFPPGEWCACCSRCGQLTNVDQVPRGQATAERPAVATW